MFKTNLKGVIIDQIKPIAYLNDLSGVKLIVEIPELNRSDRFAFMLPPGYEITKLVFPAIAASAIAKHSYIPCPQETALTDPKELKNLVKNYTILCDR